VKSRPHLSVLALVLLLMGFGVLIAGCMGFGEETTTTRSLDQGRQSRNSGDVSALGEGLTAGEANAFSTFKNKDPFIQQAVAVSTTTTTAASTTTTGYTTTTRYTTTTYRPGTTTTYRPGTTTTTHAATTTTTSPHRHSLKILSVGVVGGSPAVTFQVDNSIYKDRRVGDVVSTSWGQVKVLDLSTASKVATLLHGSETVVLAAGQLIYE